MAWLGIGLRKIWFQSQDRLEGIETVFIEEQRHLDGCAHVLLQHTARNIETEFELGIENGAIGWMMITGDALISDGLDVIQQSLHKCGVNAFATIIWQNACIAHAKGEVIFHAARLTSQSAFRDGKR